MVAVDNQIVVKIKVRKNVRISQTAAKVQWRPVVLVIDGCRYCTMPRLRKFTKYVGYVGNRSDIGNPTNLTSRLINLIKK